MKKLISILCVLTMLVGVLAVSAIGASAVDSAKTAVDVKSGDEVSYTLNLGGVAEPVIGCDFSFYYDSSLFDLVSVADFNGSTDQGKWLAAINTQLDGEVRGNWSILNGVDFSEDRDMLVITLKAKADGTGHLSYFIRYMYDNNIFNSDDRPQITEYKLTCTVLVNGEPVLEKAQPELNVEETQTTGLFVNSVTGDSKDADANIPGTVVKKNDTNSNVAPGTSSAPGNAVTPNNNVTPNNPDGTSSEVKVDAVVPTTAEGYFITATDADGNVTATSDEAPVVTTTGTDNKGGGSPVLWIIIALVVLAGGGAAAYFYMKKKPASAPADDAKSE